MTELLNFHFVQNCKKATILALKTDTVPPYTTTNTVFYGEHDFYVIDPAPTDPHEQATLAHHIAYRLQKNHKFLGIILTHHHSDHIGATIPMKNQFNVPIIAHPLLEHHVNFGVDTMVHEGDTIYCDDHHALKIFHTPGHADSHIVIYDPKHKCLVAGDMITDRGTILIPPLSGSLKVYLSHLERLTVLDIDTVIPAHGSAITDNAHNFLLDAIKHRLTRIEQIYEVIKNAPHAIDATDITLMVYRKELPDNMLFFAQLSVESSLYWLKENGLVSFENYRWRLSKSND